MAIALDAVTTGQNDGATTLTISHVVANQSNRLLIFFSANERNAGQATLTGVTYNSVALTKIRHDETNGTNLDRSELWYLLAPDVGTFNCVATYSAAPDGTACAVGSYYGVAQQAPEANAGNTAIASNSLTVDITTITDNAWTFGICAGTNSGISITNTGQTERFNITNSGQLRSAGGDEAVVTAGASSMVWSFGAVNDCCASVAAFKAFVVTTTPSISTMLMMGV